MPLRPSTCRYVIRRAMIKWMSIDCSDISGTSSKWPLSSPQLHIWMSRLRILSLLCATPNCSYNFPYIFCLGEDGTASRTAQADRAHHPDEIQRSNGQFRIEFNVYLAQQILPFIDRLCAPFSWTDSARLIECLGMRFTQRRLCSIFERFPGLDPTRFQTYSPTAVEWDFAPLRTQMSDELRFQDCEKFMVWCRKCDAPPLEFVPAGKSTASSNLSRGRWSIP